MYFEIHIIYYVKLFTANTIEPHVNLYTYIYKYPKTTIFEIKGT